MGVLEPVIIAPDELRQAMSELFEPMARVLCAGVGVFLEDSQLPCPAVRIVIAEDLMAAAASERERLGLPAERRVGAERVGGRVAGKHLLAEDGRSASIVLDTVVIPTREDALSALVGASAIAHELGHLVYATSRASAIGTFPDVSMPWEVAPMIALIAAEEYRVDRLSQLLVEIALKPSDSQGNPIPVRDIFGPAYADGLAAALDHVLPGLRDAVLEYRDWALDINALWARVVHATEGSSIYLAHTEAYASDESLTEKQDHPAATLLRPFWVPFLAHVRSTSMLPGPDEWWRDRERLGDIGLEGLQEVWRRLGLEARPAGDSFHLSVCDPTV